VGQSTWLPSEGQRLADEWGRLFKRSRTDLKQAMDQAYEKLGALSEGAASAEKPKPKAPAA
jgi:hypothetical protein